MSKLVQAASIGVDNDLKIVTYRCGCEIVVGTTGETHVEFKCPDHGEVVYNVVDLNQKTGALIPEDPE